MPQYNVEITRRFYVTDQVTIEAASESDAYDKAWQDYDKLKSEIPQFIYEYMEFEESDIRVLDPVE